MPVALEMVLQVAVTDIGHLTYIACLDHVTPAHCGNPPVGTWLLAVARAWPRCHVLRTDPPARPIAVAANRHDETRPLPTDCREWPKHTHPEPPRFGGSPDSVVVPRSGPVLEHPH